MGAEGVYCGQRGVMLWVHGEYVVSAGRVRCWCRGYVVGAGRVCFECRDGMLWVQGGCVVRC